MNYTAMRDNTVTPLLTKYGKTMYLVGESSVATGWVKSFDGGAGAFKWTDSDTGVVVYTDPTVSPIVSKTTVIGVEKAYKKDEIDGSVILETDRRFVIQGNVTPVPGGKLEVGGDTVTIVSAKRFSPATVNLAWELHCRG